MGERPKQAAEARTADNIRSHEDKAGDCGDCHGDCKRFRRAGKNQSGFRG